MRVSPIHLMVEMLIFLAVLSLIHVVSDAFIEMRRVNVEIVKNQRAMAQSLSEISNYLYDWERQPQE